MSHSYDSFAGARFRSHFHGEYEPGVQFRSPVDADLLEWNAIDEAVNHCGSRFVMLDLGAGYGWWGINAAAAVKARDPRRRALIVMVEAEPTHYEWLRTAVADNPYPGVRYRTVGAAVGTKRGSDWFYVGNARNWYGQRLIVDHHRHLLNKRGEGVVEEPDGLVALDGYKLGRVPLVTLDNLLPWYGSVDLIDMDIQGTEADLIESERDVLVRRVKRMFVSTHTQEVHERVLAALQPEWDLRFAYDPGSTHETENGRVEFEDGQQFWVRV